MAEEEGIVFIDEIDKIAVPEVPTHQLIKL